MLLGALGVSLAILVETMLRPGARHGRGRTDFGAGLAAFAAGWLGVEILESVTPLAWSDAVQAIHFTVLLGFAMWVNFRLLRVLRESAASNGTK